MIAGHESLSTGQHRAHKRGGNMIHASYIIATIGRAR